MTRNLNTRSDKLAFCKNFVRLNGKPIEFDGRSYLPAIYGCDSGNLVLRASRQVEKSTFLANTIIHQACTQPGIKILFVCPRTEQARLFSYTRLIPMIVDSPVIRRRLLGRSGRRPKITSMIFDNGSQVFIRSAYHSADSARGISADTLMVDEFQDMAAGDLPVLMETMSHATNPRTILTGTPKDVSNHLEDVYRRSTAGHWVAVCPCCSTQVDPDERCLGPDGPRCPTCQGAIDFRLGRWAARNPNSTWGQGFWVNHTMVPWIEYESILEKSRSYNIVKFKNEALGLPTTAGELVVTRSEL